MYKKEDNIFLKHSDFYLIKVQYKNIWYDSYIDLDDYEKVSNRHWRVSHKRNKVYLVSGSKTKGNVQYLHNFLMNYTPNSGYEIDHLDGNSLNNRKSNLKLVSRQENIDNTKVRIDNKIGIRGVSQNSKNKMYKCDFVYHGQRYYFKDWKTLEEAVYCRKYAEEFFKKDTLIRNPLAQQFFTLSEEQALEIKKYVYNKISGN